jgi:hypothetical protein
MNDVVVVVSGKNTDFKELCGLVGADNHGEVWLVWDCYGRQRIFERVTDVVVGNSALSCTRKNLDSDNYSCRSLFCATPANYGLTNGTTYG